MGWIISIAIDLRSRARASKASPEGFSFLFYLKDNKMRLATSLFLIASLGFSVSLIEVWIIESISASIPPAVYYLIIGLVPDAIVSKLKKSTKSFLQPINVEVAGVTYNRVDSATTA